MRKLALLPILLTIPPTAAFGQCLRDVFSGHDAEPNELFGSVMEVSGDLAVVASRRDSTPGWGLGTAFVFERGPDRWKQVQCLAPPPNATRSLLGSGISIDGTRIGLGAYVHLGMSGPAFLYDRAPSGCSLVTTFRAPEQTPNDVYGRSIAIDGDTALVSRSKDSGQKFEAGSVYVFERRQGAWVNTAKLEPSDPQFQGRFGNRVDLDGDCAMIGAWWAGDATQGAVYFFERNPAGAWTEVFKFEGQSLIGNLGTAVLLDGTRAFAGQPRGVSRVHVFERGPGSWTLAKTLQSSDRSPGDFFGTSLGLDGDTLVVGAPGDDDLVSNGGSAYAFRQVRGAWRQVAKLTAPSTASGDTFGQSIGISGDWVLVGAPSHDGFGADAGAVYAFTLPAYALPFCQGTGCPCGNDDPLGGCTNSSGHGARLTACESASLATDDLVLSVQDLPPDRPTLLVIGDAQLDQPFADGKRCVGAGQGGLYHFLPPGSSDSVGALQLGPGIGTRARTEFGLTILAGETWSFQAWYRDPGGPCGMGFNTSNGLAVTFEP